MNRKRRFIAACLLLCLLLSACSFGKQGQKERVQLSGTFSQDVSESQDISTSSTPQPSQENDASQRLRIDEYAFASLPLPEGMVMATAQRLCGDRIYAGGIGENGAVFGYTCPDRSRQTLPIPAAFEFIYAICEKDEGIAVLCGTCPIAYYDAQENMTINDPPEGKLSILSFDAEGTFLTRTDLRESYPENGYTFKQMTVTDKGYVLQSRAAIVAVSYSGEELGRIYPENASRQFAAMQACGGQLYAISGDIQFQNSELHRLDLEQFTLASTLVLQGQAVRGLGLDESGKLLVNNQTTNCVAHIDLETGNLIKILSWDEIGLASQDYLEVMSWDDGYLLYEPYQAQIPYLRPATGEARQELILACDASLFVAEIVNDFNLAQNKYRVKVERYGNEDNTMDLLRTEMIAGNAPDLYCFPTPQTFGKAACADLLPFLDADPDTGRQWFLPSLLDTMMEDGKLYWMPYTFSVNTWVTSTDVFSHSGVSPDEWQMRLKELDTTDPIFECFVTSQWLLYWYSGFAIGQFVDFEQGVCSFDTPEFAEVLQFCKDWGTDGEISMTPERPVMKFEHMTNAGRTGTLGELYHDTYCYVGFPTENGNGSMFDVTMCFALSDMTEKQDGAWAFLHFAMQRLSQSSGAELQGLGACPHPCRQFRPD